MGATDFYTDARGETAAEAFQTAVSNAEYESGHGGYTGTIAEKDSFKMVECEMTEEAVKAKIAEMMEDEDCWVQDKWGPAACIEFEKGRFVFFGIASE